MHCLLTTITEEHKKLQKFQAIVWNLEIKTFSRTNLHRCSKDAQTYQQETMVW